MKRLCAVLFAASLVVVASAHIGSPDVYFEGNAGPYSLRVRLNPPRTFQELSFDNNTAIVPVRIP